MRHSYRWLVAALLLGAVGLLGWGIASGLARQRTVANQTSHLSQFSATAADGTTVQIAPRESGPTVLIYFETDCDHCQQEAAEYRREARSLGAARVLWLASAPQQALRDFAASYGIAPAQVLHLNPAVAQQHFGFGAVPDIIIYRADGSLAKRFKGQTSFKQIRAYL